MADEEFRLPRLAAVYDALDGERRDLEPYVAIAAGSAATRVLDLGCGTGVLALLLADLGLEVLAVDPADASLAVARAKPGADRVRWVLGDVAGVDRTGLDLALMTGNAAQALTEDADWRALLAGVHAALRPGGRFVFETRDPAARAWEGWTRSATLRTVALPDVGSVTTWTEVVAVEPPLVTFRSSWTFAEDGATLVSTSTLRFRGLEEVRADLTAAGFAVDEVRDAPDRPGLELVLVARAR